MVRPAFFLPFMAPPEKVPAGTRRPVRRSPEDEGGSPFTPSPPVAGAAAGRVVAVPGAKGNEFDAAGGVGTGHRGVGEGFWSTPRTRKNAFFTHFAPPASLTHGRPASECHRGRGEVYGFCGFCPSTRLGVKSRGPVETRISRIVRMFFSWLGFLGAKNPNGRSAKSAESAKNACLL